MNFKDLCHHKVRRDVDVGPIYEMHSSVHFHKNETSFSNLQLAGVGML